MEIMANSIGHERVRPTLWERLKVWLRPNKIHKLELTNSFSEFAAALLRVLFGKLVRAEKTRELEEAFKMRFNAKKAIVFPHARTALHIDPERLKKAITPKSKAILITYLCGIVPDVTKIQKIAREHGLKIIEDGSQCFDAFYNGQRIGTFGDAAFFSLTNFHEDFCYNWCLQ